MKTIQTISDGYSWTTRRVWFECETMEEYNQTLDQYKKEFDEYMNQYKDACARQGNENWWMWKFEDLRIGFINSNWGLDVDADINVEPFLRCSDGWHYSEGKYIKGKGFIVTKRYERSSESFCYLMPGCEIKRSDFKEYIG